MIVAVTGGAGSGKTSFCQHLESKGAAIVDADFLGWELLKDELVKHKLIRAFGEDILVGTEIDRGRLAELAFDNTESLKTLNAITHPPLKEMIRNEALSLSKSNDIVIIDVALHHELDIADICDKTILIRASDKLLEKRVDKRILDRRKHQKQVKGADYTVDNDGTIKELHKKADDLWKKLNE